MAVIIISWLSSHTSIVLERPTLSIIAPPHKAENTPGTSVANAATPIHITEPVEIKIYHGKRIWKNWFTSEEIPSMERISFICLVFCLIGGVSISLCAYLPKLYKMILTKGEVLWQIIKTITRY